MGKFPRCCCCWVRWNSHDIQGAIVKRTIRWHLVHSQSCAATTSLYFQNSSITPREHPISIALSHPSPGQPPVCFLSIRIYLFRISHIKGPSASSFTLHHVCKVHPWCSVGQRSALCPGWVIHHCTDIPHSDYRSSTREHLGCLRLVAVTSSAAMNTCIYVSVRTHAFISLGYIPRSGFLGHTEIPHWMCQGTAILFSITTVPFYALPINTWEYS